MRHPPRATSVLMLACCLAACSASGPPQGQTPFQPSPAMTAVLQERLNMRAVDPSTVTIARAREVPNLIDAMHAIPNVNGNPADSPDVPTVRPLTASGADGPLPALLYQPAAPKNTPLIIYFPSGTWVTGGTDQYDETARQLARRSGWVVVSLGPRHAPEVTFPAIHDDAFAAYQWARAHAREWGADPTRVVLAGEGPGANLALSTALLARDRRAPVPNHLLLITPLAGTTLSGTSMAENGRSLPLTRRTISWAQQRYTTDDRQLLDPRIDLQDRTDLAGMPPTTVVLAEIDPTRSGGEAVAAHLSAAGVPTDVRLFPGTTSDFFGLGEKVPDAAAAEDYAVHRLQAAFVRPVPSASPVRRPTRRHRLHRVRNLHEGS